MSNQVELVLTELIGKEIAEIIEEFKEHEIVVDKMDKYVLGKLLEQTFKKGIVFGNEINNFLKTEKI